MRVKIKNTPYTGTAKQIDDNQYKVVLDLSGSSIYCRSKDLIVIGFGDEIRIIVEEKPHA